MNDFYTLPLERKRLILSSAETKIGLPAAAINDNDLWESIQHHRSIYTAVQNVDYSKDLRKEIVLIPPANVIAAWETDYNDMCQTMIYGEKLPFGQLLERIQELEARFHTLRH